MCLAIPMEILRTEDSSRAVVRHGSGVLSVDISLLESAGPGDYVIVHAGYAIEVLRDDDAEERLSMFEELRERPDER